MYIINEENTDLRDELAKYKGITYDERMKAMKEENQSMKVRIGQLLERIHDLEDRTHQIEAVTNQQQIQDLSKHNAFPVMATKDPLERPGTAQVRTSDAFDPLLEQVEEELDMDIQAMLERNKQLLSEMKDDIKDLPDRKHILFKQVFIYSTKHRICNQKNQS